MSLNKPSSGTIAYTFQGGRVVLYRHDSHGSPYIIVNAPDGECIATIPLPQPERRLMIAALEDVAS